MIFRIWFFALSWPYMDSSSTLVIVSNPAFNSAEADSMASSDLFTTDMDVWLEEDEEEDDDGDADAQTGSY